ncbi:uncharacterized protein LOC123677358 isoform X2 [Harmonia axyridis]|uniref:uncharacterized protein LOC123677358 isoform X2 n=1 Tax=Harmonia axyridis TaxID=115357 RepID=UPI001E2777E9|nr:uncharacterized protein LOC123677358 isoform X2 [Harmonia axyridis]XP_045469785.1 uncharacterized protein LOC123677358 isoform X2 [Harmonia axyridis]
MHWPVYLAFAVLVIATKAEDNSADYYGSFLEPINIAPEQETLNNYLLPKIQPKYKPDWRRLGDPSVYLMSDDLNSESERLEPYRSNIHKRYYESYVDDRNVRPSLSIKAPIDALRKAMMYKNWEKNVQRNRELLQRL